VLEQLQLSILVDSLEGGACDGVAAYTHKVASTARRRGVARVSARHSVNTWRVCCTKAGVVHVHRLTTWGQVL
jgi:hypothetical protein